MDHDGGTQYHWERGADPKPQSDGAQPIMIDYQRHFTTDPEICGGQTVVTGTRVTLRTVLATLAEGASIEEVLVEFPTLSPEAVRAVIALPRSSPGGGHS